MERRDGEKTSRVRRRRMKAARIDDENEETDQSLLTLPAACLEPPGECERNVDE